MWPKIRFGQTRDSKLTIFQNGPPRIQSYPEMGTELLLECDQVPRRDLNRLCWPAYLQQSARVI